MHIGKIVTLWNWTINGSGEKLQMPIGNDSGIHQNVTEGISSRDLVSAGLQSCEFGPVEFLFQHVKDIIVNLVGAAHRRQSAAFRDDDAGDRQHCRIGDPEFPEELQKDDRHQEQRQHAFEERHRAPQCAPLAEAVPAAEFGRSWAATTVWRLLPVKGETAGYA
ncbi:hypothetical protein HFO38_18515 [Rhizobium leguminosarum]|uniref:hypothetical protein n=1 Tax=Rhizobium leguminosarum TaxID=384 RepID=UPI001C963800|nr:hypothetical protein [Rhizobium leguminosarum]MBY5704685.1 hypothetical protein [Rhizobium leguminosarum]